MTIDLWDIEKQLFSQSRFVWSLTSEVLRNNSLVSQSLYDSLPDIEKQFFSQSWFVWPLTFEILRNNSLVSGDLYDPWPLRYWETILQSRFCMTHDLWDNDKQFFRQSRFVWPMTSEKMINNSLVNQGLYDPWPLRIFFQSRSVWPLTFKILINNYFVSQGLYDPWPWRYIYSQTCL
jgi:hypothetical protein